MGLFCRQEISTRQFKKCVKICWTMKLLLESSTEWSCSSNKCFVWKVSINYTFSIFVKYPKTLERIKVDVQFSNWLILAIMAKEVCPKIENICLATCCCYIVQNTFQIEIPLNSNSSVFLHSCIHIFFYIALYDSQLNFQMVLIFARKFSFIFQLFQALDGGGRYGDGISETISSNIYFANHLPWLHQ